MFSIFQSEEDTVMADRIYGLNDIVDSVDQNGRKVIFFTMGKRGVDTDSVEFRSGKR